MSEHRARISWSRNSAEFSYDAYPRAHRWSFEGGIEVSASAAPDFRGDPERVDPEQAFVAALASCHMLTFLAIAARRRLVVDAYEDAPVGLLEKDDDGHLAITRVRLRPAVHFADPGRVPPELLERMHEQAHAHCFLANSVRCRIDVEPA